MRIGVNALYLIPGGVGGTEIYLRNLLQALRRIDSSNDYFVFTNQETGADLVPSAANFHHLPQPLRATSRPLRLVWEQFQLPREASRLRLNCLFNPGFTAPAWTACPNVTVFHDLQHKRHPEHFRPFDLPFWNAFLWLSVKRSACLIADSEATRLDLLHYYGAASQVAWLGAEDAFFEIAAQRGETAPMLLCVSTLHPHKNLVRLVRVFARFHEGHPEFRLVIAGMRGFHAEAVESAVHQQGIGDAVKLTGWIPREDLYNLFRQARAFIYPSTFEGFGLPVVEAMAAGVPLASSSIEPLRGIVGNGAELFDPESDDEMLRAMRTVLLDEEVRADLISKGCERAKLFRWENSARVTLGVLEQAAR